ncbi:RimK family alpha-L-glutamate ligase [Streptomyces sp. NPDC127106]|uniref:ATP-grasp domain-containing protein n=1 Tax=Streptomyces sp. NPDC127106 TaxID=3345360 RepID=UPI00362C0FA7
MTVTTRVALATSAPGLDADSDMPALLEALRARGLDAEAAAWDDEDFDWSGCDAVVIRSTWDYPLRRPEFLAWADAVQAVARLDNPAGVVRWNTDKVYLRDLAGRGVPVVPTRFVAPGEEAVLPDGGEFVVKPSVSAGAYGAARYTAAQRDLAVGHVAALHDAGSTVMVQPYLSRIDEGERALVFLGGAFSHAIRKDPVLTEPGVVDNDRVPHPNLRPHRPSAAELALARAALAAVPERQEELLYARVDIAYADDGSPVVMELELVEPNLFMDHEAQGPARFADLVYRRTAERAGVTT